MLYTVHSDKGIVKKVNQDSAMVKKAVAGKNEILFAVVCDGMGGLCNGEVASAEVVEAMQDWFMEDLPELVRDGLTTGGLRSSLNRRIVAEDEKITAFSRAIGDCGTTLTGLFLCAGRYLCVNVGDSRIYRIRDGVAVLLTHDQTVVQQMIDNGEITQEQALSHRMKNVLLQCVGVEGDVVPDYTAGRYEKDDVFILCSDGFRHKITGEEMAGFFPISEMRNEKKMKRAAVRAVETVIGRGERDNITVVVIRA